MARTVQPGECTRQLQSVLHSGGVQVGGVTTTLNQSGALRDDGSLVTFNSYASDDIMPALDANDSAIDDVWSLDNSGNADASGFNAPCYIRSDGTLWGSITGGAQASIPLPSCP
jgi:hypothetical protein